MNPIARRLAAYALLLPVLPAAAACSVEADPLSFGSIDPLLSVATDSAASLRVACEADTEYAIAIGSGAGSFAARRMHAGAEALDYQLYVDASRVGVWGDGTQGSQTVSGSAGPTGQLHTVYGRVPAQRQAVPGLYADVVVITVSW